MMLTTYRRLLPRYRNYLLAAGLLFGIGIGLGVVTALYHPEVIEQAFQLIGEQLERLGKDILEGPLVTGMLLLFWHNLRAVLLVALGGLLLGIYPAFAMLFNGLIIGVVGVLSAESSSLLTFFAGILPHGIFEIPALLLGAAIGLRFGLGPLFSRKRSTFASPGPTTWQGYGPEIGDGLRLLTLAVLLLAVAAVIEVGITPLVIQGFGGIKL